MGKLFDDLMAYFETEEGKKSWDEWANKIANEQEIYSKQLQRAFNKFGVNIEDFF